jgi:outer membrane receptor protein involved in Fe transport
VNTAIKKEAYRLVKSDYTYIQPEHVNSFEVGYKGVWLGNKLFIDVDYYFTKYNNFIGQLDVTQPYKGVIGASGGVNDSTAFYAYNGGKQVSKFKMWTNSKSVVTNQGVDLGITYNFLKNFNFSTNVSYAALVNIEATDAFTPAFNTPKWITNISIGNREIIKNTGFNVVWHSQSSFYWNSPLAQGNVPSYSTFDAQINHRLPALFSTIKLAATNIFNNHYYQYLGGPVIGGFYYCSVVIDLNKNQNER